jgi:ribose-phosphate pyrophosphokinase
MLCESGKEFGKRIYNQLAPLCRNRGINFKLLESEEIWFKNGEVKSVIREPIRGDDVYIVQLLNDPLSERSVNDNFIAFLTAVDAAHQSDAGKITALLPQFPYARQERRKEREGITAKIASRIMEDTGVSRLITIDVHSDAVGGFFDTAKMENLHASKAITEELNRIYSSGDFVVVAPDTGGTDRARFYAKKMGKDFAIIYKARDYSKISTIDVMKLIGEVEGRDVFVVDDMVDTGGTIVNACQLLKDHGAKRVVVACTFPFLSGDGVEKMQKAYENGLIDVVIGSDAVFRGGDFIKQEEWYREVSVADLFANVIYNINQNKSISVLLD